MLAGWLPDREQGLSDSQQLEENIEASFLSCGRGFRASCRRDNGEDSGAQHREANKPNSRKTFRYITKASAAAALPEAKGKKNNEHDTGKVLRVTTILFIGIVALDLSLRVVEETAG